MPKIKQGKRIKVSSEKLQTKKKQSQGGYRK